MPGMPWDDRPDAMVKALILARIAKTRAGCWIWLGCKNSKGYGIITYKGRGMPVHRVLFQLCRGEVGPRNHLDHLCCVPSCIRPDHLEEVTPSENIKRGFRQRLVRRAAAAFAELNPATIRADGRKDRKARHATAMVTQ